MAGSLLGGLQVAGRHGSVVFAQAQGLQAGRQPAGGGRAPLALPPQLVQARVTGLT